MKKIFFFIFIIVMGINNSSAQGWYHNMEKYWWYRYRLVNDYLYIDPNDGAGSCIPAQHRTHSHTNADLRWEDATIRLGHYIGALAVEYRMLKDNGWDTWRTEYELYHAIRAFDRLDQNAETMCRDINGNFPYSPGPWGTPWTTLLNNNTPGPLNGFFLRDDVPFNNTKTSPPLDYSTSCSPDFVTINQDHFNRPGIYYNTAPGAYNVPGMTLSLSNPVTWVSNTSFMGRTPTPTIWPPVLGFLPPIYPDEESQDQLADMFTGLALATNLLDNGLTTFGGIDIRHDAADAEWRIISWIPKPTNPLYWWFHWPEDIPFSILYNNPAFNWQLKNPLTMRCVYCGYPNTYGIDQCVASGAFGIGLNAWTMARAVKNSAGDHYPSHFLESLELVAETYNAPYYQYYWLYQGLQLLPVEAGSGFRDIVFSDAFTAVSGAWEIPIIWPSNPLYPIIPNPNTSFLTLCNHACDQAFCSPHFPLIYRINFSKPGIGFNPESRTGISYTGLLDAAPECDPSHYPTGITYTGMAREWTSDDRLAEWYGRDGYWYYPSGHPDNDDCDYNGLDYMMLFALYGYHMGSDYIGYLINPYYTRNYSVNYPDGSYGTTTSPLTLNFLEYISLVNTIFPGGNLTVRGAHEVEKLPGFEAQTGSVFEAISQDYICSTAPGSTDSYHFAEVSGTPIEYSPTHIRFTARMYSDSEKKAGAIEDSLANIPIPKEAFAMLRDSMTYHLKNIKDTQLLSYLIKLGFLNSSDTISNTAPVSPDGIFNYADWVQVYPNPTKDIAYLSYQLYDENEIHIQLVDVIGQDFSYLIEQYQDEQGIGKYKLILHSEKLIPGFYYIKMSIGKQIIVKKLSIL